MKKIECKVKGISGLLMHAFPMMPIEDPPIEKRTPEQQAELAAYRTPEGKLYIPGIAVQRCLIQAAAYSKGKGRASLQKMAAAGVLISPDRLEIDPQHYDIDSRPVVIKATGGRIIRHRPHFAEWKIGFTIEYDENLLTEKQIRRIVDDAGTRVGLLDFRPERKGPFGRFIVTEWK